MERIGAHDDFLDTSQNGGVMFKVLVADDHPVVREGLKQIVARADDMVVVAEASDGPEVLQKNRRTHPDVVLLDISMPGRNGLEVLKQLKAKSPRMPILVLSQHPEEEYAIRALRAGASGYLTKESASGELITALRKVVHGGKYVSPSLAEQLASEVNHPSEKPLHETLSDREYEVLCLIGAGKTVSEIAVDLSLSVKTVSTYRTRILEKMNMAKTVELVRYVIQHQLLSDSEPPAPARRLKMPKPT